MGATEMRLPGFPHDEIAAIERRIMDALRIPESVRVEVRPRSQVEAWEIIRNYKQFLGRLMAEWTPPKP